MIVAFLNYLLIYFSNRENIKPLKLDPINLCLLSLLSIIFTLKAEKERVLPFMHITEKCFKLDVNHSLEIDCILWHWYNEELFKTHLSDLLVRVCIILI